MFKRLAILVFTACAVLPVNGGAAQEAFSASLQNQWTENRKTITALGFQGEGCGLLIGDSAGGLFYWDSSENKKPAQVGSVDRAVMSIAFHPLEKKAFITANNNIHLWSQSSAVEILSKQRSKKVSLLAVDQRGDTLASVGSSGDVDIWSAATGVRMSQIKAKHRGGVAMVGFAKEGEMVITFGKDLATRLWDSRTQRKVREIEEQQGTVLSADFNPQANILAIGKSLTKRQRVRGSFQGGFGGGPGIHPTDLQIYNLISITNTLTGERVKLLHDPTSPSPDLVALTPDARFVVTGSSQGSLIVWNITNANMVSRLPSKSVTSIAICPTGRMMAVGERKGTVSLYQLRGVYPVATGKEGLERHSLLGKLVSDDSQIPTVAVFNLKSGSKEVQDVVEPLSDALRTTISSSGQFKLVEREKLNQIMEELALKQAGLCESLECQTEAVNLTGAQKFINGSLAKMGKNYVVSLYLLDAKTGEIENSVTRTCACSPEDLLALMKAVAAELMVKM